MFINHIYFTKTSKKEVIITIKGFKQKFHFTLAVLKFKIHDDDTYLDQNMKLLQPCY